MNLYVKRIYCLKKVYKSFENWPIKSLASIYQNIKNKMNLNLQLFH